MAPKLTPAQRRILVALADELADGNGSYEARIATSPIYRRHFYVLGPIKKDATWGLLGGKGPVMRALIEKGYLRPVDWEAKRATRFTLNPEALKEANIVPQ